MKLKSLFANTDAAIGWQYSLAVVLGMAISGGLGYVADRAFGGNTIVVSVLVGLFLSILAVSAPFVLAMRLILVSGTLMIVMVGLATLAAGTPWLEGVLIGAVLLVGSLWNAIPLFGGLIGTFPAIIFILITSHGSQFAPGASLWRAMLGALFGLLGAVMVALIVGGGDPRKASRNLVAKMWSAGVSREQQGSVLQILRLDSAPAVLTGVLQASILAAMGRDVLTDRDQQEGSPKPEGPIQDAFASDTAIAHALPHRGPLVPRDVGPAVAATLPKMSAAADAATDQQTKAAWHLWSYGLSRASALLSGSITPPAEVISGNALLIGMWRSLVRPDASAFRFGVQRAVAVGLGVTVLSYSRGSTNVFWVVLSIFTALQADAAATTRKAAQAAVGTWGGAMLAVVLSLFLPKSVLVPWLAIAALVIGFAWMARNYATMTVGLACAIVLVTGAPQDEVIKWAGFRALDVALGAGIAIVASLLILRVKPRPAAHLRGLLRSLERGSAETRRLVESDTTWASMGPDESGIWVRKQIDQASQIVRGLSNLRSDVGHLPDDDFYRRAVSSTQNCADALFALTAVTLDSKTGGLTSLVLGGLDQVDGTLAKLDEGLQAQSAS